MANTIDIKGITYEYTISYGNLHIVDSYRMSKRDMLTALYQLKQRHHKTDIFKRSVKSLRREWATHNLLYALGIARERTKDVDLNHPQKWYVGLAYFFCGAVALIFIK